MFVIVSIILGSVTNNLQMDDSFAMNQMMRKQFLEAEFISRSDEGPYSLLTFEEIGSLDDLNGWLHGVFVPHLFQGADNVVLKKSRCVPG